MLNVVETLIVSDYFDPIAFLKFSEFLEVRQDPTIPLSLINSTAGRQL
jgi:hypothetical protein